MAIIAFNFNQVKHILYNYDCYSGGVFPDPYRAEQLCIHVPVLERARFEAACLLAAEVGIRVKRCGFDGMMVEIVFMRGETRGEAEVARQYHLEPSELHRRINKVTAYCTGRNIGCPDDTEPKLWPLDYKIFCKLYRHRRAFRKNGTECAKGLTNLCLM